MLVSLVALNIISWLVSGAIIYALVKALISVSAGVPVVDTSVTSRIRQKVSPQKQSLPQRDSEPIEEDGYIDLMDVPFEQGYEALTKFREEQEA